MLAAIVLVAALAGPPLPDWSAPVTPGVEKQLLLEERARQVWEDRFVERQVVRELVWVKDHEHRVRREAAGAARRETARRAAEEKRKAEQYGPPLSSYRITATFGESGPHWSSTHTGLDLAAPTGTRVGSVHAGKVIFAGRDGPYGNKVTVRHSDGSEATYAHLSSISAGGSIGLGEKVGEVGETGNVTGPHLHLELRDGGLRDPYEWLASRGVSL